MQTRGTHLLPHLQVAFRLLLKVRCHHMAAEDRSGRNLSIRAPPSMEGQAPRQGRVR